MQSQRFQIRSKHHFLTYPQWAGISKEYLYDVLLLKFKPTLLLVAHELHQDGSDHYHCYLKFDGVCYVGKADHYDVDGHHGNYQGCRSYKNVLQYCTKGENYKANFDISSALAKSEGFRKSVAKRLLAGEQLPDVANEFPQLLFGYTTLKRDLARLQEDMEPPRKYPDFLPNPWGILLPFNNNSKRRHYWIYSVEPNAGKTYHFARPLRENHGAVVQTGDFSYWNVSSNTGIVILDEYNTARLKWDQLNSLADGFFGYRVFSGGVIQLKSPLIIILSNSSIISLYPFMHKFISARFTEIEVKPL